MAAVSPAFKEAIRVYLAERADNEPEFAVTLAKPQKNLDDCLTYILNQVKNSGQMGFADEDIYNMAVHYYDEDDIKIGHSLKCNVVVNHHVESQTPKQVKSSASKPVAVTPAKPNPQVEQLSLF